MAINPNYKHSELTDLIIAVFYDVYNELGFGFLESVYRNSLRLALLDKGLTVEQEVPVAVFFRGHNVGDFPADLVVNGTILLELKTAEQIVAAHESQVLNYLRSTALELGLVLKFWAEASSTPITIRQFPKTCQGAVHWRTFLSFFRSVLSVQISGRNL